jgi:hypothetical protein
LDTLKSYLSNHIEILLKHISNITEVYLTLGERIDGGDGILLMQTRLPSDDDVLDPHPSLDMLNLKAMWDEWARVDGDVRHCRRRDLR